MAEKQAQVDNQNQGRDKHQVWISSNDIKYIEKSLTSQRKPTKRRLTAPGVKSKLLQAFIEDHKALLTEYRKLKREANDCERQKKKLKKQINELKTQTGGDANGSIVVLTKSELEDEFDKLISSLTKQR